MGEDNRKRLYKAGILLIWLCIWHLVSVWVNNSILLVGPDAVFRTLVGKLPDWEFWRTIFFSLIRISGGLLAGWILGLLLAVCSACCRGVEEFLKPLMTLMKTVPVASFVVLFLPSIVLFLLHLVFV